MAKKIEVQIVGDASSLHNALNSATSGTSKFGGALGALAKTGVLAAGAAGVGAVAITLRQGIKEYTESAKVAAQTNAVIKSTGGIANVTAKEVDKLATSMMRKSGVDDEAIATGENMILTFKNIRNEAGRGNDIFNQTSQAVLDMDTAMTQGNVTAESMAKTSIRVGKALNDPIKGITALARVGVTFTEGQKDAIKAMVESGNIMGAQKMILKELTSEFGGSAEAIGKTLPGQLNILKESFNNFAGDLVAKAVPAVQQFVDFLNTRLIPAEGFTAKLKVVWEGLSEVSVDLWNRLEVALMGETRMVRLPMEKAVEFVEIEGLASKLKTAVREKIAAIDWSDVLVTVGVAIGKGVIQLQIAIWTFLFNAWKTAWSMLLSAAGAAAGQLAGVVVTGMSNLPGAVGALLRSAMNLWVAVFTGAVGLWLSAATALGNAVLSGIRERLGGLPGVVRGLVSAAAGAVRGLVGEYVSAAVSIGRGIVSGILSGVSGLAGSLIGSLTSQLSGALNAVKGRFGIKSPSAWTAEQIGKPLAEGIITGLNETLAARLPKNLSGVLATTLGSARLDSSATAGGTGIGTSLKGGIDTFLEDKLPGNLASILGLATSEAMAKMDFSQSGLGVSWTSTPTSVPVTPVALGPSRLADPDAGTIVVNINAPIGHPRQLQDMVVSALADVRARGGLA